LPTETLQTLVDKHAPFADIRLHAHPNAPWYDGQCRLVKMKTRKLERAYRRDKSKNGYQVWRQQSTLMRHFLQKRYTDYWRSTISDNVKDPKALWSKISALLDAPKAPTSTTAHTADAFANHFQSKVEAIRDSTSYAPHPLIDFRSCATLQTMKEVTADEVTKIISRAPVKHCSLDPAPTWLVKRLLPLLADPISRMCNASIIEGVFPSTLKQAIVKPRLKKPTLNPDDLSSYRPISNLSFISKVVERVIAARFSEHFESQGLLPSCQSAYRANHSTETAITAVYDEIVRAVDSGDMCALVLLDLSSAFDTVDHDTLLAVLHQRFGIGGVVLDWCRDYLCNRTQTFQSGPQLSGPHSVRCSVPQGSVLGPKKFIAYTEDLVNVISRRQLSHHLYADDTQLLKRIHLTEIPPAVQTIQCCVQEIHGWCASRRLQLNPAKTELIWFGSRTNHRKTECMDLSLYVGKETIKPVSVVRDLGVLLDKELTMNQHISKMASVAFYHIRRLRKLRTILGAEITASLVSAFILSRLDYCNTVLTNLPVSTTAPLQRAQNAAARLIKGLRPRDHVTSALRDLHWLPIRHRVTYKLCVLMHLVHIGSSPSYLSGLVTATANIPFRKRLRSADINRYEPLTTRLKFGERCFSHAGPKAWNALPTELQDLTDHSAFKRQLKTFLFERAFTTQ